MVEGVIETKVHVRYLISWWVSCTNGRQIKRLLVCYGCMSSQGWHLIEPTCVQNLMTRFRRSRDVIGSPELKVGHETINTTISGWFVIRRLGFAMVDSPTKSPFVTKIGNWRCKIYTRNSSGEWGDEIANVNFCFDNTFNHFYSVRPGSYRIRRNNAK